VDAAWVIMIRCRGRDRGGLAPKGRGWHGSADGSDNAEPTVAFFRDVLGLRLELDRPGFWMLKLPDGSKVEVFRSDSPVNRHFTTGPVAGFLVDDVQDATAELRSAGLEILFESGVDDSGNAWVHFRAPDGNIYEFTQDPGVSRPHERGPEGSRLGSTPLSW
jgi:catechol 2,3-dioxygenase-like lactoylglutathione lyase family enzyme